jgi:hypothetical protein
MFLKIEKSVTLIYSNQLFGHRYDVKKKKDENVPQIDTDAANWVDYDASAGSADLATCVRGLWSAEIANWGCKVSVGSIIKHNYYYWV